jgi:hypothetical protein
MLVLLPFDREFCQIIGVEKMQLRYTYFAGAPFA